MRLTGRHIGEKRTPRGFGSLARYRIAWASLVVGTLLFDPAFVRAQEQSGAEYRVKLAFLYNFTQFVQWPSDTFQDPSSPLLMCVAGQDPFNEAMEKELGARKAGGHPILIKRLKPQDNPKGCQLIFIRAGDKKSGARLLAALKGSDALTVGEEAWFTEQGGLINLAVSQHKLTFEINLDAAAETRLKLSSKLLALARIVSVNKP